MSVQRLLAATGIPEPVKRAFTVAGETRSDEEDLWRARVARMTLDAFEHTGLTAKPREHNEAVRYARLWFRGVFDFADGPECDNSRATFDFAGVDFPGVRRAVLDAVPVILEDDHG